MATELGYRIKQIPTKFVVCDIVTDILRSLCKVVLVDLYLINDDGTRKVIGYISRPGTADSVSPIPGKNKYR